MKRLAILAMAAMLAFGGAPGTVSANGIGWGFVYSGQSTASGWPGGVLDVPAGVAVDKFGTSYVVSGAQDAVNIYDATGALEDMWGASGAGNGELTAPRAVDVDRWGNVYVLDKGNRRVSVFNPGGEFVRHISGPGLNPHELSTPNGLAVSLDGDVYVTDSRASIKRFTSYGALVAEWPSDGPVIGIGCDQDGGVWAANDSADATAPDYGNTVMKYSSMGVMQGSWGTTGTADGQFDRTYDIGVDGGGRVFAVDAIGGRMQVFDSAGAYLTKYTGAGATPSSFSIPYAVGVGYQREALVADTFNDRVVSVRSNPAIPTGFRQVAGADRYATAKAASQLGWPGESEYALVATALNWPDALSGAGLAGACGGPLLLTRPDALSPEVASEITRLNCDQVYVLGGTGAVSSAVYSALEGIVGVGNVHRLGGANRYATSALIARETVDLLGGNYDGTGIVVTGRDFPDALAVSPIAAANAWPVLLTEPDHLPSVIADAMTSKIINHGYVIGGTGAVGPGAFAAVDALWIGTPHRVAGATRYSTAAAVAQLGFEGLGMLWSRPAIATGENFPDALAGGVLQGSDYSVMLLTRPGTLDASAAAALSANRDSIYEVRYLGGTAAVSTAVRSGVSALLH